MHWVSSNKDLTSSSYHTACILCSYVGGPNGGGQHCRHGFWALAPPPPQKLIITDQCRTLCGRPFMGLRPYLARTATKRPGTRQNRHLDNQRSRIYHKIRPSNFEICDERLLVEQVLGKRRWCAIIQLKVRTCESTPPPLSCLNAKRSGKLVSVPPYLYCGLHMDCWTNEHNSSSEQTRVAPPAGSTPHRTREPGYTCLSRNRLCSGSG